VRSIVTGAARGLGESIAARLLDDEGDVALLDVDESVVTTIDRLRRSHPSGSALPLVADVSDAASVSSAVRTAVERLGGIDLLVNNAGVGGPSSSVVETPVEAFRRVLEVNLVGAFLMAQACAPVMMAARTGTIVNVGSIFGQHGVANGAGYCASKGGLALLTHSLALELAPYGIRVNTVAPGNMLTEMHLADLRVTATLRGVPLEDEVERVRASIPLERHGTGEDVAGVVAWLASEDAAYVTGQTIGVNGGVVLT
jgi:NAD(P)-dependent dehydrogenase (short-subunit alcohol dehydrogenase family)